MAPGPNGTNASIWASADKTATPSPPQPASAPSTRSRGRGRGGRGNRSVSTRGRVPNQPADKDVPALPIPTQVPTETTTAPPPKPKPRRSSSKQSNPKPQTQPPPPPTEVNSTVDAPRSPAKGKGRSSRAASRRKSSAASSVSNAPVITPIPVPVPVILPTITDTSADPAIVHTLEIRHDVDHLVEHVRAMAMEGRPSTPGSHIDWAGEDDDSLPDLDDWGISTQMTATTSEDIPHSPVVSNLSPTNKQPEPRPNATNAAVPNKPNSGKGTGAPNQGERKRDRGRKDKGARPARNPPPVVPGKLTLEPPHPLHPVTRTSSTPAMRRPPIPPSPLRPTHTPPSPIGETSSYGRHSPMRPRRGLSPFLSTAPFNAERPPVSPLRTSLTLPHSSDAPSWRSNSPSTTRLEPSLVRESQPKPNGSPLAMKAPLISVNNVVPQTQNPPPPPPTAPAQAPATNKAHNRLVKSLSHSQSFSQLNNHLQSNNHSPEVSGPSRPSSSPRNGGRDQSPPAQKRGAKHDRTQSSPLVGTAGNRTPQNHRPIISMDAKKWISKSLGNNAKAVSSTEQ